MLVFILILLGYFVIAGIMTGVFTAMNEDHDNEDHDVDMLGLGMLWPISLPLLIIVTIITFISVLTEYLIDFKKRDNITIKKD